VKRDDDLLRKILLDAESQEDYLILVARTMSSDRQYEHHIDLLCDAGFLAAVTRNAFRITNSGHDYIAAIRDDNLWQKTKDGAASVGGVTLGIMKEMAVSYLKQQVSEKLGIVL
jgi:hypothetical protein